MDEKKFLNLTGLSSFLANLKKIFATAAQGTKADSAYTHAQSAHAPSNAERNIIVGIQKNGSDLTPNSSRKVNVTVPTKVSELTNDSGYKTTDTTYSTGTASVSGITKLYTGTGTATDGTMTQNAITSALNGKAASSHTHNYAGSSSVGGSATSAVKLDTSTAGSATQPVYFSSGKPVACTYTLAKSVPSNAVFTDTNTWIALKGATTSAAGTAGYAPAPSAGAANRYLRSDGTWAVPPDTNTTYTQFKGATASAAGGTGLVPAPSTGYNTRFLRGDGTWQALSLSTFGVTATAAELNKLDGVTATAAELNYVDGVTSNIQTQLNGKASSTHTHNYAGSSSAGGAANSVKTSLVVKLNGGSTEGTNMFTFNGATAKSVNITPSSIGAATSDHTHSGYAASSHNHSTTNITSGTLAVARGGTGITSNPSMLINLASTSAASVFATSPRPGVTGTLPIARGGTGGTTAATARSALGAIGLICQASEPTAQNTGELWFKEV